MRAEGEFTIHPASPLSTHPPPTQSENSVNFNFSVPRAGEGGRRGRADPRQCRVLVKGKFRSLRRSSHQTPQHTHAVPPGKRQAR